MGYNLFQRLVGTDDGTGNGDDEDDDDDGGRLKKKKSKKSLSRARWTINNSTMNNEQ